MAAKEKESTKKTASKKSSPKKKATSKKSAATKSDVVKSAGTGAKKKTAAKKAPVRRRKLTPEQRYTRIEEAAYLLAEANEFKGDPVEYWLQAEKNLGA